MQYFTFQQFQLTILRFCVCAAMFHIGCYVPHMCDIQTDINAGTSSIYTGIQLCPTIVVFILAYL